MESLNMMSLDEITEVARPDGVRIFVHKKHPYNHKFVIAVGIAHSILFASSLLSSSC